jgi:hypothetical protein
LDFHQISAVIEAILKIDAPDSYYGHVNRSLEDAQAVKLPLKNQQNVTRIPPGKYTDPLNYTTG